MLNIELLRKRPEEDVPLFGYHDVVDFESRNYTKAISVLETAIGAGLTDRHILGVAAFIVMQGHDLTPNSAPLTRLAYRVFSEKAKPALAATCQCWSMVEELARHYSDIQDCYDKVIKFAANYINHAPTKARTSFDALLRMPPDDKRYCEIIRRYYVHQSGANISYEDFIRPAVSDFDRNIKEFGEDWRHSSS